MSVEDILSEMGPAIKAFEEAAKRQADGDMATLVGLVWPLAMQFGQLLLGWLTERRGRYEEAPSCPRCGGSCQRHGHRRRQVVTRLGEATVKLVKWRCAGCRGVLCPGVGKLGLRRGCSPEIWSWMVSLARLLPFRTIEQEVLGPAGIALSDNTVERLALDVGRELVTVGEARRERVFLTGWVPREVPRPERLYLQVDGFKVRVDHQWREVRVGVIYETPCGELDADGRPAPPERVGCIACWADADTFMEQFYVAALERGLLYAKEVVFIADGAPWIWNRVANLMPPNVRRVEILDFWHAAENVARAVRAALGEDTAPSRFWSAHLRGLLRAGQTEQLLDDLRRLRDGAPEAARGELTNVLAYLTEHRRRTRYQSLEFDGYHLGSGQVESHCKRLGQRFKGPGMNWSEEGLSSMLAVCCWGLSNPGRSYQEAA